MNFNNSLMLALKRAFDPERVRADAYRCMTPQPCGPRYGFATEALALEDRIRDALPAVTLALRRLCGWHGRTLREHLHQNLLQDATERFIQEWDGDPRSVPWLRRSNRDRLVVDNVTASGARLWWRWDGGAFPAGYIEGDVPEHLPRWKPGGTQ